MTPLAAAASLAVHRSRKLIPEFRLHRPRSAAEAVALKAAAGAGAVFMAGGIDVVNRMKFGVPVTDLIHLGQYRRARSHRGTGWTDCSSAHW